MRDILIVALMFIFFGCTEKSELRIINLKCEYQTNPLGIDITNPRLSWILDQNNQKVRGQKQSAYHIHVASSPDKLDEGVGDLWDTGKIESDQSVHIEYKGKPLESGMACYWKVRVWDNKGKTTHWSKMGEWSMGLLKPEDWTATWITNPAPKSLSHPWLRRTFD